MTTKNSNAGIIRMIVSFTLIFSILLTFISQISVNAESAPPDITVKLNGTNVNYDQDITLKDKDKLEIIADFKSMNISDVYEVELPGIFINLNEETIRESNKDILQYIKLSIVKDEVTGKQKIKIEFLKEVDAASFSFWAIADVEKDDFDELYEIIIDGETVISVLPVQPPQPPNEYVGPQGPLTKVPDGDSNLKKGIKNQITEKEFLEDKNINNAIYYNLGLNLAQQNSILTSTLKDTLPTGMKLFIPSAPNCGKDSYDSAFMSFSIFFSETLIKGTDDNNCYIDISDLSGAAEKYIKYVNAIEISQGREGNYTVDDLAPTIKIPPYVAENIKNTDGKYVTYSGSNLGYKIDETGTIQITMLDKKHEDLFEKKHTGPWTDTSLYIPLYNTADCETSIYWENRTYKQIVLQSVGNGNASSYRQYQGFTVNGTKTSHKWSYSYNGTEEFVLVVTNDSLTDTDSFEIEMKGTEDSLSFGKALQVQPRIYFDKTKWNIPSTGEIIFKNTVTYSYWEKTADTKYVYDFGNAGTVVAGAEKTVEDGKTNHLNPDSDSTVQEYKLTFRKIGNEKIPAGNFEVFDRLDSNLVFLKRSLKIYKEMAVNDWMDITDSAKITEDSSFTTMIDGINLKVYYDSMLHRIVIVNVDDMTFTGRVRVAFRTELAPDVEYGTKIVNYFGETVTTFVDHKLAIRKIDSEGKIITSNPAVFSIKYTTDEDFENGTLYNLTDSHGNTLNSISTGAVGIAEALYRIDADSFYIKIDETGVPNGYIGLLEPVWIRATRNSVTGKIIYSLAKQTDGINMSVDEKGLVTLDVENVKIAPVSITLEANKITEGKELVDGQFNFAVYENEKIVATGTNAAAGKIIFTPISYTTIGNHTYTIKETSQSSGDWIMDSREFTVYVKVSDNGDGTLSARASYPEGGITFVNKYMTITEIPEEEPPLADIKPPKTSDDYNMTITLLTILSALVGIYFAVRLRTKCIDKIKN